MNRETDKGFQEYSREIAKPILATYSSITSADAILIQEMLQTMDGNYYSAMMIEYKEKEKLLLIEYIPVKLENDTSSRVIQRAIDAVHRLAAGQ